MDSGDSHTQFLIYRIQKARKAGVNSSYQGTADLSVNQMGAMLVVDVLA